MFVITILGLFGYKIFQIWFARGIVKIDRGIQTDMDLDISLNPTEVQAVLNSEYPSAVNNKKKKTCRFNSCHVPFASTPKTNFENIELTESSVTNNHNTSSIELSDLSLSNDTGLPLTFNNRNRSSATALMESMDRQKKNYCKVLQLDADEQLV